MSYFPPPYPFSPDLHNIGLTKPEKDTAIPVRWLPQTVLARDS